MRAEEYIATRMIELCKKHKTSKYRLSQLTGISQTSLGNIIKGQSIPTIINLEKICDAFGITIAQFFAGDQIKPDLTPEQKEILDILDEVSGEERRILLQVIRSFHKH